MRKTPGNELALPVPKPGKGQQRWLHDALRQMILRGSLAPGIRLPATRDLSRQYGLARGTVASVYEQLAAEGYVAGAVGRGTFVAGELPENMQAGLRPLWRAAPQASSLPKSRLGHMLAASPFPLAALPPATPFRPAVPDLRAFPTAVWARVAAGRLRRSRPDWLQDGDPLGYVPLRREIAGYAGSARGIACSFGQVAIFTSVQQALDVCSRLLLEPGECAWIEEPGYPGARRVLAAAGADLVHIPVDNDGLVVAHGIRAAPNARLAYVTPARQSPTGVPLSAARRQALLEWAHRAGAALVEDDYDGEYRFSGRPLAALKSIDHDDRVIFLGSFSKLLFPALRIAYAVLPASLVEAVTGALSLVTRQTSSVLQVLLHEFIADGHFGRHIRRMRLKYRERAEALQSAAKRYWQGALLLPEIEAGLDVAARLTPDGNDRALAKAGAAQRLELRPLSAYAARESQAITGFLLGFAPFSPEEIDAGARQVARLLEHVPC
ncbi:MAG TPA: PLP-dependent aminotransferase family protein [Acetobacteraceae bacterium]